jgi:hypothetical protein
VSALDLVLFGLDADGARRALAAGIRSFIVDWEDRGKIERQRSFDTEVDPGTPEDLGRIAGIGADAVWCRLNAMGPWTPAEVDTAVARGASLLLLPMVRRAAEVERFLGLVAGRVRAGILVETDEAVRCAGDLARLPLDAVYVGLNDLAISRGYRSLFEAVLDGTVEAVRRAFPEVRFGFAGVTTVDRGHPVPCPMLLQEMERLGCGFSFLRRSFRRDVAGRDPGAEIARIHGCWAGLAARTPAERERDRAALCERIHRLVERPA